MENTRTLFSFGLSGNSQKVRILLNALGLEYTSEPINIVEGEHKKPAFLTINPRGQVPALRDGQTTIIDSHAILVYLAIKHDQQGILFPRDATSQARIQSWLSFSANELQNTIHLARLHFLLNVPADINSVQAAGSQALSQLDQALANTDWLVGDAPTIADIACAPMVALATDAQIPLDDFANVLRWLARFKAQSFFVALT